jgi:hypothetical protein
LIRWASGPRDLPARLTLVTAELPLPIHSADETGEAHRLPLAPFASVRGAQCPLTAGRVLWIVHVDVVTGGDAVFAFSAAGASATAREMDVGFVVLAGSTARGHGTGTFPAGYQALCEQLVQDGRLVDGPSPELFMFAVDVAFASPSAASSIVAARSASGPREWRLRGSGQ